MNTLKTMLMALALIAAPIAIHAQAPTEVPAAKATDLDQKYATDLLKAGADAPDITLNTIDGKPFALKDLRGRYVVLDFWASWCGPCRAEMPNVKAAYEKYKGKGFNIVALSFDNKLESWTKAIEDMQMPWIHLSDLKGWKTVAGQIYGVNAIPASFLVDPNGTIIAADLRGEKLEAKLKEVYGE